jgi:dTDP-4-amino-4,6-dideoxygalactose transaminase
LYRQIPLLLQLLRFSCRSQACFVDVHPLTYNIDVADAVRKLTPNTAAIMPVHLYGNMAEMDVIMEFAKNNNLLVIEDCAQAIGAEFKGAKAGSFGDAGCFSFYPAKNLGGLGQGGAVVSNDRKLIKEISAYGNVGRKDGSWYEYDKIGFNSRLDSINAWFLRKGLEKIDEFNQGRRHAADMYDRELASVPGVSTPKTFSYIKHVYHLYELKFKDRETRDGAQTFLKARGIYSALHYPVPCHEQDVYKYGNHKDLSTTEILAGKLLSLPMHPFLNQDEVKYICDSIKEYLN